MMAGMGSDHEPLKRRWEEHAAGTSRSLPTTPLPKRLLTMPLSRGNPDDDVVPSVTVVIEGRSICPRVRLDQLTSYDSLAATLRRLLVDTDATMPIDSGGLSLSNAVPGHLVAYEDMEGDLLLAGDLNWKDFVRVVRRIRIIPANPRQCGVAGSRGKEKLG